MDSITIGIIGLFALIFASGFVLGWVARGAYDYRPSKLEQANTNKNKPAGMYQRLENREKSK